MIVLTRKPSHNRHTLGFWALFQVELQRSNHFTGEALPLKNLIFIGEQVW
jgi:hypothetical protein